MMTARAEQYARIAGASPAYSGGRFDAHIVKPAVELASRYKLRVCTQVADTTIVHNQDTVRQAQGRQPMRDENNGAPLLELHQCPVSQTLALHVNLAGGFIENEDRRIAEDGAS